MNNEYIYLPNPESQSIITVGERHFFKSKIWKLLVICNKDWRSNDWTLNGISIWNVNGKKKLEYFKSILDDRNIKYSIVYHAYQTNINISMRKKNLEIINDWYNEYYESKITEIKNSETIYYQKDDDKNTYLSRVVIDGYEQSAKNIKNYVFDRSKYKIVN